MSFFSEVKARVLKYDFIHGLYLVPLGIVGLWVTAFHLQYVLHVIAAVIFCYAIVEGARLLGYNPIKKEALKVIRRNGYIAKLLDDHEAAESPVVTAVPTPPTIPPVGS